MRVVNFRGVFDVDADETHTCSQQVGITIVSRELLRQDQLYNLVAVEPSTEMIIGAR